MKYLVLSIKCIILLFFFGILNTNYQIPNAVFAEEINLKIEPATLQVSAQSPADIKAPFTITNQSFVPVNLRVLLKTFRDNGDGSGKIIYSNPHLTSDEATSSFLKQVKVLDDGYIVSELTLGPKQQKNLELLINIPDNTSSQDQYFSIVFLSQAQASEEPETEDTISSIQAGIALPVLLSVNRKTEPSAYLDTFSGPVLLQNGPVPFTIKVENTGQHFVQARGVLRIKNMFGQTVGNIEIPTANILSGSTRVLANNMSQDLFSEKAKAGDVVWSENFLLGFYTASLTLAISPDQSLYTRDIHFFAFPTYGFFILFIIIILGGLLLRRIKKKISQG